MSVRIEVLIQHHPARAHLLPPILAEVPGATVVVDPDPGHRIPSPWRTYRACLLAAAETDATHALVIQDDVRLCRGFLDAARTAVGAQPDRPVVFFVGGNPRNFAVAVLDACRNDLSWAELDNKRWCPVVATCWPSGMIGPLMEFVEAQGWNERHRADDDIVGRFFRHENIVPIATVPSLVEHPDLAESVAGRRSAGGNDPGRVAACWIGDCEECDDATLIDWTRGP